METDEIWGWHISFLEVNTPQIDGRLLFGLRSYSTTRKLGPTDARTCQLFTWASSLDGWNIAQAIAPSRSRTRRICSIIIHFQLFIFDVEDEAWIMFTLLMFYLLISLGNLAIARMQSFIFPCAHRNKAKADELLTTVNWKIRSDLIQLGLFISLFHISNRTYVYLGEIWRQQFLYIGYTTEIEVSRQDY